MGQKEKRTKGKKEKGQGDKGTRGQEDKERTSRSYRSFKISLKCCVASYGRVHSCLLLIVRTTNNKF